MKFQPIALRAWEEKAQTMHNFHEGVQPILIWGPCLVWMRMSGIADFDGVEAGEGDIIEVIETEVRGIVRFFKGCFVVDPFDPMEHTQRLGSNINGLPRPFKIIGNIFTHKHLIPE